ncbi:RelA/SpoT [Penicillium atrosanguineum]|uniref:RelA/SpoT n=1 Tax=Penicillium atrosanguineum TaxID=1132637 RepID=A0A9W9PN27_9EURO|nr:RelA/SpoT [Penicillium atrosanguineum]
MAIPSPIEGSCIPTFINQYKQEKYAALAKRVADLCNKVISENGISLQTESRGKEPESLQKKLEERERESGPYKDSKDIYDKIIDLAGARIILNRPEDRHTIKGILYDIFEVSREKLMDQESGYKAVHYVVYLKKGRYSSYLQKTEARTPVEIQVQSHGIWQWSKLEHDSIYKMKRDPSPVMRDNLGFSIRAITLAEDFAQHTREMKAKKDAEYEEKQAKFKEKLKNPWSVGHYLDKWIPKHAADWAKDKSGNPGSATALYKFLDSREWRTAECLDRLLKEHLGDGAQDEYSKVAREYGRIDLNLIIYLIDREVLKHEENELRTSRGRNSNQEHLHKIRVLLSTFIWMNRLFPHLLNGIACSREMKIGTFFGLEFFGFQTAPASAPSKTKPA